MNGEITRSGVIDKENTHDFCYQCSKDGPEFLFINLIIWDCREEPHFLTKRNVLSCQIKIK